MSNFVDTIAAVSTAAGRSAISLIRVSGPDTFKVIKRIFKLGGKRAFPLAFSAYHGDLIEPDTGLTADKVVVIAYLAPYSYTGEDVAEISTHGNPVVVSRIMGILLSQGIRAAEAGEFTRRAFINGKMDLLDVEAVSHLLSADSVSQAQVALNQLDGLPSKYVAKIRDELVDHLVQLEASLNFPEDAIEAINEHKLKIQLTRIRSELAVFVNNANQGSLVANGVKVALVGRPNSGKSSLLNLLLGRDRAIVTEVPGTTRDTLEETISIGNIPIRLVDTAGLRQPGDQVEAIGIERSRLSIEEAYAVVGVFDASEIETADDIAVLSELKSLNKPVIFVLNKKDLKTRISTELFESHNPVYLSALNGDGFNELVGRIEKIMAEGGISNFEEMVLLGAQQTNAINKALAAVDRACEGVGQIYQDMLAIELEDAVSELGRVTGQTVDVNTLDLIFERFCIGK